MFVLGALLLQDHSAMRLLMVVPAVALALSASDLEQEMQSLLQRRCLSCHGPNTKPQGSTVLLFPETVADGSARDRIECRNRLDGMLRYYARAA